MDMLAEIIANCENLEVVARLHKQLKSDITDLQERAATLGVLPSPIRSDDEKSRIQKIADASNIWRAEWQSSRERVRKRGRA